MRIIYALAGQGRGHSSRVTAIANQLRTRGHDIAYCCGGTAADVMTAQGHTVIPVPALRHTLKNNKVRVVYSAGQMAGSLVQTPKVLRRLTEEFSAFKADLVISDFEAFSTRAAARLKLPVIAFNHQAVVTHTRYSVPARHRMDAAFTSAVINAVVPRNPRHVLVSSFYFPEVRNPATTTLVPPILRDAVRQISPTQGDHVLVYHNDPAGAERLLEEMRGVDAKFVIYNFPEPADLSRYPNMTFKRPSMDEFLIDLASCRAVICTAGFTLASEALYLGKPMLVMPNRGIFEQTLNALYLQRDGLGEAVIGRDPSREDIVGFLARTRRFGARPTRRMACGNDAAVACIERMGDPTVTVQVPNEAKSVIWAGSPRPVSGAVRATQGAMRRAATSPRFGRGSREHVGE